MIELSQTRKDTLGHEGSNKRELKNFTFNKISVISIYRTFAVRPSRTVNESLCRAHFQAELQVKPLSL